MVCGGPLSVMCYGNQTDWKINCNEAVPERLKTTFTKEILAFLRIIQIIIIPLYDLFVIQ